MKILNHFNITTFLRDYWQKQPLLIRNALDPGLFPLTPEELAGLACEEEIESRLITGNSEQGFMLRHGPFVETDFTALPEKDWTVLVQAVDHIVPEVAELLEYFRFIPNWRIDDVMVSFAATGGSAGPHYDNYDVFLIQGAGTRLWQVGEKLGANPALSAHDDLRLLSEFKATQEWELQPGDILYLPPRYGHWGIATNSDCMTYSVGFRSPSIAQLISDYCDDTIIRLDPEWHYQDPAFTAQNNPGEISALAIETIQRQILDLLSDDKAMRHWLGNYLTLPKYPIDIASSDSLTVSSLHEALKSAQWVYRNPASRLAYTESDHAVDLFVNGEHYPLDTSQREFAYLLCGQTTIAADTLLTYIQQEWASSILLALFTQDSLYFDDDLHD